MPGEFGTKEYGRQKREENILLKILRILAQEHLISLEEELQGRAFFQKGELKW